MRLIKIRLCLIIELRWINCKQTYNFRFSTYFLDKGFQPIICRYNVAISPTFNDQLPLIIEIRSKTSLHVFEPILKGIPMCDFLASMCLCQVHLLFSFSKTYICVYIYINDICMLYGDVTLQTFKLLLC